MSIEIKVPELPESVAEATVGEWHKNQGDAINRDDNLVDLETDKVMLEVPATDNGKLVEIRAKAGATVTAGDVLAVIEKGEGAAASSNDADASEPEPDEEPGDREAPAEPDEEKDQAETEQTTAREPEPGAGEEEIAEPSPAARKLLNEHGLKAADVRGSGRAGRITKADVLARVESGKAPDQPENDEPGQAKPKKDEEESAPEQLPADVTHEKEDRAALSGAGDGRTQQRVPLTRIRARIAERLLEVSQNTAMLTTFNEVNMQAVTDLRERYKDKFQKNHDVRLGFMAFFVKATVEALKRFPVVNATLDGGDVVYHGYYDIGIAVSSPRGLLVPILRDADQLSYAEVEADIRDLGKRSQDGKIKLEELTGGTFTITNGGVYGSLQSTPILNPPQSAILGMHAIKDRPVAEGGQVVIRPMMNLALSYDHRLIDGRDAVLFLRTIKELIEDPPRLLLQI